MFQSRSVFRVFTSFFLEFYSLSDQIESLIFSPIARGRTFYFVFCSLAIFKEKKK